MQAVQHKGGTNKQGGGNRNGRLTVPPPLLTFNDNKMRSEFCEFLDQMQHVADADGVTVAARHHDVLNYYFKMKYEPAKAYHEYKNNFLPRWNAITDNGKNTEAT